MKLLTALLLASLVALPTAAGAAPYPPDDSVDYDRDDLGGFASGRIDEYVGEDRIVANVRLEGSMGETDAAAQEWTLELFAEPGCAGEPFEILLFQNPPDDRYGPRVFEFFHPRPWSVDDIGSALLVHEGLLVDHGQSSPGRHELACAST